MNKYTPKDMPEITLEYDYTPAEKDLKSGCQVEPPDVRFQTLRVNGYPVCQEMDAFLLERFGDDWEGEIIANEEHARARCWLIERMGR